MLRWTGVWSPPFLLAFTVQSADCSDMIFSVQPAELLLWVLNFRANFTAPAVFRVPAWAVVCVCSRENSAFLVALLWHPHLSIFSTKTPSNLSKLSERLHTKKQNWSELYLKQSLNNLLCWCVQRQQRSFKIQVAIPFASEVLFLMIRQKMGHPRTELLVLFLPETPWSLTCHGLACLCSLLPRKGWLPVVLPCLFRTDVITDNPGKAQKYLDCHFSARWALRQCLIALGIFPRYVTVQK